MIKIKEAIRFENHSHWKEYFEKCVLSFPYDKRRVNIWSTWENLASQLNARENWTTTIISFLNNVEDTKVKPVEGARNSELFGWYMLKKRVMSTDNISVEKNYWWFRRKQWGGHSWRIKSSCPKIERICSSCCKCPPI